MTKQKIKKIKTKKKTRKIYKIESKEFSSKSMCTFYSDLKKLQEQNKINNFQLPTIDQESKNKFGAKKCMINDELFDSMKEAKMYLYINEAKKQGIIKDFLIHPKYILLERFKKNGKTYRPLTYTADFELIYNNNSSIVIDVKGSPKTVTEPFRMRAKLFEYKYKDKAIAIVFKAKDLFEILNIPDKSLNINIL